MKEHELDSEEEKEPRGIPWSWMLVYLLIVAVVVTSGLLFFRYLRGNVKGQAENELVAIADLKTNQIHDWLDELRGDARTATESPFFAAQVGDYLAGSGDTDLEEQLLSWMRSRADIYGYQSIFLLDAAGKAALSLNPRGDSVGKYAQEIARESMAKGEVAISDLHREEDGESIHIDLLAPLPALDGESSPAAGAVLFRIDPHDFLYPFIQSWPTPSETAETLIVRREGEEVLFLNELRHRSGTALNLRFPISQEDLPASMAARGVEGVVEGRDYRGEDVLADIRDVPGSSWYVVTKVDASEVYSPVTIRAWLVVSLTIVLLLALGLLFAFAWSRRQSQLYRRQYELEAKRTALAQHYDYLTRYANDIIILMDRDWRIVEANERAVQAYGYARGKLIGMFAGDLRPPASRGKFAETMKRLDLISGTVFETEHQRKDGTTFPVEVSARVIETDGERFYQDIIRDIGERKLMEAELRASEELYRLLFQHTPIGVVYYDTDLVITDCNDRFVEILETKRDRLIGLDVHTLRDRSVLPSIQAALKGREGFFEGPYRATTSDAHIYVSMRSTPLRDREGAIIGIVGIVEDIGERHRMEVELRDREESLRRLTDNMLDLISQIDTEGNFVYLSPSNEKALGYGIEELLGLGIQDLVHPDDRAKVAEAYARSRRELTPGKVEYRARHNDGHYLWLETVGNPLFDEAGEPIGAIFTSRDITERKRMEERLERLNRCFLELGADPLGNILTIVDSGQDILQAAGMHYSRKYRGRFYIYHTARQNGAFEHLEETEYLLCHDAINQNRDEPIQIKDLPACGYEGFLPEVMEEKLGSYLGYPVKAQGRTVGVLGLLHRDRGGFSNDERDLMGILARAIAVEEERLVHEEELRDFIDVASHELRHPMTIIKGYAATLDAYHGQMDEMMTRNILNNIDEGVDRLERLVYQLLDTARIERGKLGLEWAEVDPEALVAKAIREIGARAPERDISPRLRGRVSRMVADPERIVQVLIILIENAVNFSPQNTIVEVELSGTEEGAVLFSVMDRGVGVPEEDGVRIFERLYQVEDSIHHSAEGIGLGLHIAREIIEAHGGRIWHEPRSGGGSIFRFTLPGSDRGA